MVGRLRSSHQRHSSVICSVMSSSSTLLNGGFLVLIGQQSVDPSYLYACFDPLANSGSLAVAGRFSCTADTDADQGCPAGYASPPTEIRSWESPNEYS